MSIDDDQVIFGKIAEIIFSVTWIFPFLSRAHSQTKLVTIRCMLNLETTLKKYIIDSCMLTNTVGTT